MKSLLWVILLSLNSVFILSCEKEKKSSGLGPQVEAIEIETAQNTSLSKLDPYAVKQGQRVHKIETQEIVTSQGPMKSLTKESATEIIQLENLEDVRLLTTVKKEVDLKDNFTYEFKNVLALPQKVEQALKSYSFKKQIAKAFEISPYSGYRKVTEPEIEGVSFHNLAKREVVLVPPQLVQESKDCRGLSPCEIKADLITYDIVFHLTDGSKQKHQLEWHISPNVPFFAGVLKQCATTVVPLDDLRVLVKQCIEVVDFNF